MPSKSKKISDKETLWQKVSETCCLENLMVTRAAAEYLYKLTTDYLPEQQTPAAEDCSMNEATVVLESLDTLQMTHHSNGDITLSFNDSSGSLIVEDQKKKESLTPNVNLLRGSCSPNNMRSSSATNAGKNPTTVISASSSSSTPIRPRRDAKSSMDRSSSSCDNTATTSKLLHQHNNDGEEMAKPEISQLHKSCRKNCINEPHCLASLGFEKWQTGSMDYDWPSDEEEDDCLVKRKKDVPVGLVNLGATCYVNAFLQLWYHNLAFRNAVFEWNHLEEDESICAALQYIFGLLEHSQRSCVDPSSLIELLGLDASQQQDAQEFSKLFIDLLPCPQIKSMFCGSYDYVTRCSTCRHESRTASQFNELDLSIEGLCTLDDCMRSFLQIEKLTGDNQYFCSNCQCKQNASRRIELRNLPPVLNIQLLRFVFDRKTGHKKKLNTSIQFPDQLELSANGGQHQYELTAVLMHSGISAFSGHYTAHIHKHDHWYSFNDANVVKLKGKKLNLTNEESLELHPATDGSATTSEAKKRGNRSKNAYMLVYQQSSFIQTTKDLQPSPVPENVLDKVEEDNSKMCISNHDAEIRQTEQMVRVEMKKDQIGEIFEELEPSRADENYHFLPVSWLNETLEDWDEIKPVDNTTLLCRHGKLNWSLNKKYKVISESRGEFIYKRYSDDKTVVLDRKSSLCYDCLKNQLRWRKYREKVEEDQRTMHSLISSQPATSKGTRYWVSKADLKRWRSLLLRPLELAAQPTDKSTKSTDRDAESKGDEQRVDAADGVEGAAVEGNNSATSSANGDAEVASANGDSDDRFNSDILCDHGNLDSMDKYRQLIPQSVWDILVEYFPYAVTCTENTAVCNLCLGEQQQLDVLEEQRKTIVKEERQMLSDLAALRNRPIVESLTTDTVYCITVSTYKHWKLFLRNPSTQSGLESIVNSSVICVHGMLCVHPSDDNSVVLLWPYEWDILSSHFPTDQTIEVKSIRAADRIHTEGRSYFTVPDICVECSQSRLISEELESHNFSSSNIYIRLLTGESKNDMDRSLHQQSADEEDDDEALPDTKKAKVDPDKVDLDPLTLSSKAIRRSCRRKKIRGDKQLRTSSHVSLKELRVELVKMFAIAPFDQVLTLDGRQLEGDDKTLAELKLYPECLLLLKGVAYDERNMEHMMLEQGVLEEGFRGTGLIANSR